MNEFVRIKNLFSFSLFFILNIILNSRVDCVVHNATLNMSCYMYSSATNLIVDISITLFENSFAYIPFSHLTLQRNLQNPLKN